MPIQCRCGELADAVPEVTFQQFIWLAADGVDVVDTSDEYIVRCNHCGQHWRDGVGYRGIQKMGTPENGRG